MSFDKIYPNRKDWRKAFRRGKSISSGGRNHGWCSWCVENRLYSYRKRIEQAEATNDNPGKMKS
jgi:hypothetical protein